MEGDSKAGFSVFWADDGLDTGPVLLQRECDVDISDTVDTLYSRFLMPEGIRAMVSHVTRCRCGHAVSLYNRMSSSTGILIITGYSSHNVH